MRIAALRASTGCCCDGLTVPLYFAVCCVGLGSSSVQPFVKNRVRRSAQVSHERERATLDRCLCAKQIISSPLEHRAAYHVSHVRCTVRRNEKTRPWPPIHPCSRMDADAACCMEAGQLSCPAVGISVSVVRRLITCGGCANGCAWQHAGLGHACKIEQRRTMITNGAHMHMRFILPSYECSCDNE